MDNYKIQATQPTVYLDEGGKPVRGFAVTVRFNEYKEIHELHVPTLATEVVSEAVKTLLDQRDALADLGT